MGNRFHTQESAMIQDRIRIIVGTFTRSTLIEAGELSKEEAARHARASR
jgi:hypothetical protein